MSCDCKKLDMTEQQLLEPGALKDGSVSMSRPGFLVHWKEFVCGGGSAFCNIIISYPLNKLIFRQVSLYSYNFEY